MDIIQIFTNNNLSKSIDIQGTIDEPLFRASQIADLLDIACIHTSLRNFDSDEKVLHLVPSQGGPQQTMFLTELGLYRILGQSRKPVAKPFQKWVCTVIKEIRLKGKYELQNEIALIKTNNENNVKYMRHQTLKESYNKKDVVYFGLLKEVDDNRFIIKIGSTSDIKARGPSLENLFDKCIFLDIFECLKHTKFEKFLHNYEEIKKYQYKDEIIEGIKSSEAFLVDKDIYENIKKIAQKNIHQFNILDKNEYMEMQNIKTRNAEIEMEMIKLENERIKLEIIRNNPHIDIKSLFNDNNVNNINNLNKDENNVNKEEDSDCDSDSDDDITIHDIYPSADDIILNAPLKTRKLSQGRKVQRYSSIDKTLIETYQGLLDASRKFKGSSKSQIKVAILNNQIYKEYRWAYLDNNLPDTTIQDIGENKEVNIIKKGFVAMLNLDKDKIENVFVDQKTAGKAMKFNSSASICMAITHNRRCSGHYFTMWDKCSVDMQQEYLRDNILPEKINQNGTKIHKLHPITHEIMHTYLSIEDVVKKYQTSRIFLKRIMNNDEVFKGYKWCREVV
jgi:prophage antirepressor-like protein